MRPKASRRCAKSARRSSRADRRRRIGELRGREGRRTSAFAKELFELGKAICLRRCRVRCGLVSGRRKEVAEVRAIFLEHAFGGWLDALVVRGNIVESAAQATAKITAAVRASRGTPDRIFRFKIRSARAAAYLP